MRMVCIDVDIFKDVYKAAEDAKSSALLAHPQGRISGGDDGPCYGCPLFCHQVIGGRFPKAGVPNSDSLST